ncbi:MAG: hypothetical protein R3C59_28830 [Planctomycetaceae bacterium]
MSLKVNDLGSERLDLKWTDPLRFDVSPNVAFAQFLPDRLVVVEGNDSDGCRARITAAAESEDRPDFFGLWKDFAPSAFSDEAIINGIAQGMDKRWDLVAERRLDSPKFAQLGTDFEKHIQSRHLELVDESQEVAAGRVDLLFGDQEPILHAFYATKNTGDLTQFWRYRVVDWDFTTTSDGGPLAAPRVILFEREYRYERRQDKDSVSSILAVITDHDGSQVTLTPFEELLPRTRVADLLNKNAYVAESKDGACVARQIVDNVDVEAEVLAKILASAPNRWLSDAPTRWLSSDTLLNSHDLKNSYRSEFVICRSENPLMASLELPAGDEDNNEDPLVLALAEALVTQDTVTRKSPIGFLPVTIKARKDARLLFYALVAVLGTCIFCLAYYAGPWRFHKAGGD